MKGVYVLVLVIVSMGTICGMAPQNTVGGGSPYSYESLDQRQVQDHSPYKRQLFTGWAIAEIIGAIGVLVAAGSVVNNIAYKDYSRNFEMLVENRLPWKLQGGKAFAKHGAIHSHSDIINAGEDGLVTGHKKNFGVRGTEGIVSWRIEERGWTIIVFWKVPYSRCSGMSLGIYADLPRTEPSASTRNSYISDLTSGTFISDSSSTISKTIAGRDFCSSANRFCTTNNDIKVCGIMSTDSNAVIKVKIEQA